MESAELVPFRVSFPVVPLIFTWWSSEDVHYLLSDYGSDDADAGEVWREVVDDLDNNTSDYVISQVNNELDSLVYKVLKLEV
mgnify:CR=1 FL=1